MIAVPDATPATTELTLIVIGNTVLAALLVCGGLIALAIGNRLYRSGVGLQKDGTIVHTRKVSLSLRTVGAVVMATSVAWGGLGYLTRPTIERSQVATKISGKPIDVKPIECRGELPAGKGSSPEGTKKLFKELVSNGSAFDSSTTLDIVGLSCWSEIGGDFCTATIEQPSNGRRLELMYSCVATGDTMCFTPLEVSLLGDASTVKIALPKPSADNGTKPTDK